MKNYKIISNPDPESWSDSLLVNRNNVASSGYGSYNSPKEAELHWQAIDDAVTNGHTFKCTLEEDENGKWHTLTLADVLAIRFHLNDYSEFLEYVKQWKNSTITSFDKFNELYSLTYEENPQYESVYELIHSLSIEEKEFLINEIDTFTDFELTYKALGWHGLNVPIEEIKKILKSNLNLANEVKHGGIYDTCQRELLIDAVLKSKGINMEWPCGLHTQPYKDAFYHLYQQTFKEWIIK